MIVFTGLGITVCVLVLCTVWYLINYFIWEQNMESGFAMAYIGLALILSVLVASFVCTPKAYGYQKIDTVSVNEVR